MPPQMLMMVCAGSMADNVAKVATYVKRERCDFRRYSSDAICATNVRMEVINGAWIKSRLSGVRGEQAKLARFLGISTDKLSKTLAGGREVQSEEVPKLLEFFNARIVSDDEHGALTPSEMRLLSIYRRIPTEKRPLAESLLQTVQENDDVEGQEGSDAGEGSRPGPQQ